MKEIKNGDIVINGILIKRFDSLTDVLQKTATFEKEIQNRNNYQYLFISNYTVYNTFTNLCLIFSECGELKKTILSFPMGDKRNRDKEIFKKFIKKSHIKENLCFNGCMIQMMFDPHFLEYSLEITYL